MIKTIIYAGLSTVLFSVAQLNAQTNSIYNYTEAFDPIFYTQNGSPYRSASGKPGHAYWQNQADYNIHVSLDDQDNKVSGQLSIRYTNNSPDELSYLWFQLDQNLYQPASRGQTAIPLQDSRCGSAASDFFGVIQLVNKLVSIGSAASYTVADMRMRVILPVQLKADGQAITLSMDFSYII